MLIVIFIIGVLFMSFGVSNIITVLTCNKKITGTFVRADSYWAGKGRGIIYIPIFQYNFKDKQYKNKTCQNISNKYSFRKGEEYNIYINEKNPKKFIIKKRIDITDVLAILFGIFFVIFVLFAVIGENTIK